MPSSHCLRKMTPRRSGPNPADEDRNDEDHGLHYGHYRRVASRGRSSASSQLIEAAIKFVHRYANPRKKPRT